MAKINLATLKRYLPKNLEWEDFYYDELPGTCSMVEMPQTAAKDNIAAAIQIARNDGYKAIMVNVTIKKNIPMFESFGFTNAGSYFGSHSRRVYTLLADLNNVKPTPHKRTNEYDPEWD